MTRLPPQLDDNLDQAASILESEVPERSTVRWGARHGAAQRCRLIPIWLHSAIDTSERTSDHIRRLHVIADMKGDGSTDRSLHPRMKRPSQRKPSSKCAEPGDLQSLNGPRPTDFLHTKSAI
jgi:hypothetical protein